MSELKNTNTQLKNNFAAAFEPILTVIIPILTQLSAWLVSVTNDISKFFAILGGKSSYTIAKKGQMIIKGPWMELVNRHPGQINKWHHLTNWKCYHQAMVIVLQYTGYV